MKQTYERIIREETPQKSSIGQIIGGIVVFLFICFLLGSCSGSKQGQSRTDKVVYQTEDAKD